ncbi:hypothetical protein GCM10027030_02120 [Luteococcus sediminum]
MVTGATGYVGSLVVERLLEEDWTIRVLVRDADKLPDQWDGRIHVVEGDASSSDDLAEAMQGADVAWFLIHAMGGGDDFAETERQIAHAFADAARDAGVSRIVYLGGLHPDGELSEHLASRVEVGEILMASGVPTAAVQAGVVLGDGSASFQMLRDLTERLPGAIGPKFLANRIQPIDHRDVVHYLVRAGDLGPEHNRTFDVGGPDRLSYAEMMKAYAKVQGMGPRPVMIAPLWTPGLASHWIGLITRTPAEMAGPLLGSLLHETVCTEDDLTDLVGAPEGGPRSFAQSVEDASAGRDQWRPVKVLAATSAAVLAAATVGGLATAQGTQSRWYRTRRKPSWQPPGAVFGPVWTALYADIAVISALHLADRLEEGDRDGVVRDAAALGVNLVLNAGWSWVFFRAHRPALATGVAGALAVSSADLVRRVGQRRERGVVLAPYAAWTGFATVLTDAIRRRNR